MMSSVGLDHVYISVSDFGRAVAFYDAVMGALGFAKGDQAIDGEPHAHYFTPRMQYTIRQAARDRSHDPYAPGLHHLCFQVLGAAEVDRLHRAVVELGVDSSAPALHPAYGPDYYAFHFTDPDGIRLEVAARTTQRDAIAERWSELPQVCNPLAALGEDPGIRLADDAPLRAYQRYVHALEAMHGWLDVDLVHNCFLLGEEVGELFKAVRHYRKLFTEGDAAEGTIEHVAEEIVDVMNYLIALANRLDIDLEGAFRTKNARNQRRTWT